MAELTKPRTRRLHTPEFKQQVVDACLEPGASVAGVALAHGVNANLVRRWLAERGVEPPSRRELPEPDLGFVPIQLEPPPPAASQDIRIERRRGATTVAITWPGSAADACAAWLREWPR
jgi:transposase